jgi:hypothetical protein
MDKTNSGTTRPATLVETQRTDARERFNPRGSISRGTDRPAHQRAELTRLVRPVRPQPRSLQIAGDVVHRFRAMALVSPAGNVYFGDDEARYEEYAQRCARARAAMQPCQQQCQPHLERQIEHDATETNTQYRDAWRMADLRRLQSTGSLPPPPQLSGAGPHRKQRRQHHRGRESRRRNNARRNHRRIRARNRHLDQMVDLAREPNLTAFDNIQDSNDNWG